MQQTGKAADAQLSGTQGDWDMPGPRKQTLRYLELKPPGTLRHPVMDGLPVACILGNGESAVLTKSNKPGRGWP